MNSATQSTIEGIRTTLAAIDTKAEKLVEIDRLAKVALSKAVGEECLFLTVGASIVSESRGLKTAHSQRGRVAPARARARRLHSTNRTYQGATS